MEISAKLKEIEGRYKITESAPEYTNKLPNGEYQTKIQTPSVSISKKTEELQIAYPVLVLNGEMKNKVVTIYNRMDDTGLPYALQTLSILGIPRPPSALQFETAVKKAENMFVLIEARNSKSDKGEFCNFFFKRVLKQEEIGAQQRML